MSIKEKEIFEIVDILFSKFAPAYREDGKEDLAILLSQRQRENVWVCKQCGRENSPANDCWYCLIDRENREK